MTDSPTLPESGSLLGVDFGQRRIGLAVSDSRQQIASPLKNYSRNGAAADQRFLNKLITEYGVVGIVVGLPVHMSGDEGQKAGEARAFGRQLADWTGLPVGYWDERFTSKLADEALRQTSLSPAKRKARRDMLAAQILLQSFLDAADRDAPPPVMR